MIASMPATIRRSAQNSNVYRTYGILSSYSRPTITIVREGNCRSMTYWRSLSGALSSRPVILPASWPRSCSATSWATPRSWGATRRARSRHLIRDRDFAFGPAYTRRIRAMGIRDHPLDLLLQFLPRARNAAHDACDGVRRNGSHLDDWRIDSSGAGANGRTAAP
jgi:hypothetical protein